jgi:uncharacterized protein DUF1206
MRGLGWIERFARVGYAAKALLYATIGVLAARAAIGAGGRTTDTRGAMATVLRAPFGRVLLLVIAMGLVGYAAWRILEAVADPERRGRDLKGLALRAGFFGRAVIHLGLAYTAVRLAIGQQSSSAGSGQHTKEAASTAVRLTGGVLVLWIVAAGVGGYGIYQLYRAARPKLSAQLDSGEASAEVGTWVIVVSRFGIAARGLVFIAIGYLLARAATRHDPHRVGGIGDALGALEGLGRWPFVGIALGLLSYGAYELLNARYRRIRVRSS